ncbi:type IV pilin [Natrinema thermotolerans]|uniref:type IV pilin n=1 Tax=Natrinema thermotolerans TaxID=121872 RepID=UPI0009FF8BE4|nr:type IV pilin N-terminal domain-containing protein [Natrinema thermotolerans]QCC57289.1 type IV pilin [Natrinema thermotolerans]
MDGKAIRNKLIGSDDQRAVSPVIGVILMVAITVILAAVIAAFVLDMGNNLDESTEVRAGASFDTDDSAQSVTVTWTSEGNADSMEIRGCPDTAVPLSSVGSSSTVDTSTSGCSAGDTVTAVAIKGDQETTVGTGTIPA